MRPLILAFDTSTDVCTVSLLALEGGAPEKSGRDEDGSDEDVRVLAARSSVAGRGHTRMLLGYCDEVLGEVGAEPQDLRAIVVGTGPGTFTGVRIAIATARAMALSVGIPVLGVSTLAALAAAAVEAATAATAETAVANESTIVPVVDARRGQLFAGVYSRETAQVDAGGGCWARAGDYFSTDPAALKAEVRARTRGAVVAVGDPSLLEGLAVRGLPVAVDAAFLLRGQSLLREPAGILGGVDLASWLAGAFPPKDRDRTGGVGQLGPFPGAVAAGEAGSPEAVRPLYIRMPDADIHITRMKDPWAS